MLVYPRAKINLGLYVTARRPDGYHDLQTVFYPIPLCDVIETKPLSAMDAAPYVLRTEGYAPCANPEDNLVVRVYRDMAREFDLPPLDILLQKRVRHLLQLFFSVNMFFCHCPISHILILN